MPKIDLSIINKYISYNEYQAQFRKQVLADDPILLSVAEKQYFEYRKLNLQRSLRVEKTFVPSEETRNIFASISAEQSWFVITESWCGDSSQSLPVIASLANLSEKIELKIVLRDSNPDFMNLYLTNGSKSIPKLVVFDKEGSALFQWGPRPKAAKDLFTQMKNEGMEKSKINKELHLWYARNRGIEVEKEITELVSNTFLVFES